MQLLQCVQRDRSVEGFFFGIVAAAAQNNAEAFFLREDLKNIHAVGHHCEPGKFAGQSFCEEISGTAAVDTNNIIFLYQKGGSSAEGFFAALGIQR